MAYYTIYISLVLVWIIFIVSFHWKPLRLPGFLIGLATIVFSLAYDLLFGEILKLYHYITPEQSVQYLLLCGIFLYPLLNILYVNFLPCGTSKILIYTGLWMISMMVFEGLTLWTKSLVFTGWRFFPWSILTYLFNYAWVLWFYGYLVKKIKGEDEYATPPS